jgi:hypothetical protein
LLATADVAEALNRHPPPAFVIKEGTGFAMAKSRRYSIEVRDAKSKAVVVSAAIDWTSDEKHVAVTQIFRLLGLADDRGTAHRLSHKRAARRDAALARKQPPRSRT